MYIMVLNDGQTWTELKGCKIMHVAIDRGGSVNMPEFAADLNKAFREGFCSGPNMLYWISTVSEYS